jgi:hypothetical protein
MEDQVGVGLWPIKLRWMAMVVDLGFQSDCIMVWNMLCHVFHGGPGWSWIMAHQTTMDGGGGYNSMKRHYLGESFAARLRSF